MSSTSVRILVQSSAVLGNDKSLASMFAKQQAVSVLNKARNAYNAQLQKGKEMGLHAAAAQAEPVWQSEKDTHDIEGKGRRRCIQQRQNAALTQMCIPKPFIPGAVSAQKSHKERQVQGKHVKRRQLVQPSKPSGRQLGLRWSFGR
jgi:hypothetical protein